MVDEWNEGDDNIVSSNMFIQIGGSDIEGKGGGAWPSCNHLQPVSRRWRASGKLNNYEPTKRGVSQMESGVP